MFIPGRIEFLGKHTDYCGGSSIVCAIDRGFHTSFESRSDSQVVLENNDSGENASFVLGTDIDLPTAHWVRYAAEVGRRLTLNFRGRPLSGASIRFHSDLPMAAGLSSSSALIIMVFTALKFVNHLGDTAEFRQNINGSLDLAAYLGCIENGQNFCTLAGSAGVGTFGGSQDHAAILLGRSSHLSKFSYSPMKRDADFLVPEDLAFVVASSGVTAEKTGAARDSYNRVSRMVREMVDAAGCAETLAQTLAELGIEEMRTIIRNGKFSFPADQMLDRVEQFRVESFEIIPAVSELLAVGKFRQIGDLVDRSQQNAEQFLGNQIGETIFLQRHAREMGAVAASAFGAGFGGSVYALVETGDAQKFASGWKKEYAKKFPQHCGTSEFFVTRPSQCDLV
ncbi:MAG: galactokinase family protein [Pyrinomonadaceae bacterium]